MPRFSVVVPAYNAAATLPETLDAVVGQTFDDWECVVVDDGSTDATSAVAAHYASDDGRVRLIAQENRGSGGAYNAGVASARGDFVVVCSADDILLPTHLEEMARFIELEPGYDIYSTNGYFWRADGSREIWYAPGVRDEVVSLSLADVIAECFYSVGATYRRSLFDEVGGYRTEVYGEDYDFWLRAMARGARHRYLPMPLSLYRVAPGQKSAQLKVVYRSDIRIISDLRDTEQLSGAERRAVEECIAQREAAIAEIEAREQRSTLRKKSVALAQRVLGEARLHALVTALKSPFRRH